MRLDAPVDHVITKDGRATGVVLADGTEFSAPIVVCALDPRRTFTELVDPRELPSDLVEAIDRYRFQGTSAKVNFALDDLPVHPALKGRIDHFGGFVNIGPSIEYLERAYDDAKYGWYSRMPYIDGAIQSVVDPDMAPPGKRVMASSSSTRSTTSRAATGTPSASRSATSCSRCWRLTSPAWATSCCTARS